MYQIIGIIIAVLVGIAIYIDPPQIILDKFYDDEYSDEVTLFLGICIMGLCLFLVIFVWPAVVPMFLFYRRIKSKSKKKK